MSHLRDWFSEVDSNRDGSIDAKELQQVLRKATFKFENSGIAAQMIRLHDQDNSGTIDFGEFEKLHVFLVDLQHKFTWFDRDKSSWLTPDETYEAIKQSGLCSFWKIGDGADGCAVGFKLDQQAFMRMINVFDPQRKGQLKLGDFVSMILFLKSCRRIFKSFDIKDCGRIVLDYDQFVYATGNARFGSQTTFSSAHTEDPLDAEGSRTNPFSERFTQPS